VPFDPSPLAAATCSLPPFLHGGSLLLDHEIRPPDFVIKPFFPRGEMTEIVGAHGAFKSTLALDACLAVATGRAWGGVPVAQGRSVFITLEDSTSTLARRVRAWLDGIYEPRELEAAERDIRENFQFLGREASQGMILTATFDGATTARLDVADHLARITGGATLVVLETVSRLHDGPETNDAFAALVRSLEHAARDCALVVVRHMSKKAAREMGGDSIDSYAGRGGGALSDAMRSVLVVTRPRGDALSPVTLTAAKTTHAKPGDQLSWTPVVVPHLESVRLEPRTAASQALGDASALFAVLAATDDGWTRSEIHKKPPEGLGRNRALAAFDYLIAHDRLVHREEVRGRNRQLVDVYYAPRPGLEDA
jgi:hypothetical protein